MDAQLSSASTFMKRLSVCGSVAPFQLKKHSFNRSKQSKQKFTTCMKVSHLVESLEGCDGPLLPLSLLLPPVPINCRFKIGPDFDPRPP